MKPYAHLNFLFRPAILPVLLASNLLACNPGVAAAPPSDDKFVNAQVIPTASFSMSGIVADESQKDFESSPDLAATLVFGLQTSVWYKWTPWFSGKLDLTADNTSGAVFLFTAPTTPSISLRFVTAHD